MIEPLKIPWKPIYPSLKSGEPSIQRAVWQGEEWQFLVQWHEDRTYFGSVNSRGNIFACLDPCREEEAVEFWRSALEKHRFGVCRYDSLHFRDCIEIQVFLILSSDGTGLARETWSHDWLSFVPKETRGWILYSSPVSEDKNRLTGISLPFGFTTDEYLLIRRISDEEIQRLTFESGTNEQEFKEIMRCLWHLKLIQFVSTDTSGSVTCRTSPRNLKGQVTLASNLQWKGNPEFWTCLENYFQVKGLHWKRTHYGRRKLRRLRAREPQMRLFLEPRFIYWHCGFRSEDEPTFHQQLEARLELREWLRGKAPAEQIEAWLHSSL
jgi:hypothetical protein